MPIDGLICNDKIEWKAERIRIRHQTGKSVPLWWSSKPVSYNEEMAKELQDSIARRGYFYFLICENGLISYVAKIIDFSTNRSESKVINWANDISQNPTAFYSWHIEGSNSKYANFIMLAAELYPIEPIHWKNAIKVQYEDTFVRNSLVTFNLQNGAESLFLPSQSLLKNILENDSLTKIQSPAMSSYSLNTIFYGPPGTGKTYALARRTVELCDSLAPGTLTDNECLERFRQLQTDGRVVFTTFHQSLAYEEFVEGIKPDVNNENNHSSTNTLENRANIAYFKQDGIFKKLSIQASYNKLQRLTLVGNSLEKSISRAEVFDNLWENLIILSEEKPFVLKTKDGSEVFVIGETARGNLGMTYDKNKGREYTVSKEKIRILFLNIENLSDISNFQHAFSTLINGHFQTLNWAVLNHFIEEFSKLNTTISSGFRPDVEPVAKYETLKILVNSKLSMLSNYQMTSSTPESGIAKPYVLIIDEINRGNVAAIFGELITLIEESKRLGNSEGMTLTLPYSGDKFGVPNNLYIIGTMNTADRSVEALDAALRRRFTFEEMPPRPDLLKGELNLDKVLETINSRIQYLLTPDHRIGHAYLMNGGKPMDKIEDVYAAFFNKIIPQLKEYFYVDHGKIGLVLGKSFVEKLPGDEIFGSDTDFINQYGIDGADTKWLVKRPYTNNSTEKTVFQMDLNDFEKALALIV